MHLIRHVIRNQSIGESLGTYGSNIAANSRKKMHSIIDEGLNLNINRSVGIIIIY